MRRRNPGRDLLAWTDECVRPYASIAERQILKRALFFDVVLGLTQHFALVAVGELFGCFG